MESDVLADRRVLSREVQLIGTRPAPIVAARPGLRSSRLSVTPFALEGGHLLAGLDHDRGWLTAATTLPHDLRGKLLDRFGGCGHRLLSLRSEFGLAE